MPRNKKEGIIFGICICAIMVFFMGLLNISIHLGGFNLESIKTNFIAFPVTFIIAFILENLVIGKINHMLLDKFVSESDSKNAYILFNCFLYLYIYSGIPNLYPTPLIVFIYFPFLPNLCLIFFTWLSIVLESP